MKTSAKLAFDASPPTESALKKRWQFAATEEQRAQGAQLAQILGLPEMVGRILAQRQPQLVSPHIDAEAAFTFLSPKLAHLPDPLHLLGMREAFPRIIQAIQQQEQLAIFGDYDVDGACASAVLLRYFRILGLEPLLYVPDRLTEGYGPNPNAMEKLAAQGVKLVITVDCGSTAHEALAKAQELGMDVIVTDHHQCPAVLPEAVAVINPNRLDQTGPQGEENSPCTMLCGAGVAFYLLLALNRALREAAYFTEKGLKEPDLRRLLDLVATATIADMVPLTGANRPLLALGMTALNTFQNEGIRALAQVTETQTIDATAVGFRLGPRINAAGRLADSTLGAQLLSTLNEEEALALAARMDALNVTRQEVQEQVLQEAMLQAEAQQHEAAIVVAGAGWHPGVVGIVAARVKEQFYRPTFVLSVGEDGSATGSGRSISGVDLGALVQSAHTHITRGGGHAMAAGVTLPQANIAAFTRHLQETCGKILAQDASLFTPCLRIDDCLTPAAITASFGEKLAQLEPYGSQNREPLFAVTGTLLHTRAVGQTGAHLKLRLGGLDGSTADGIAFGAFETDLGQFLHTAQGKKVTLAAKIRPNTYQGITRMDLQVQDAVLGNWGDA